MDISLVLHHRQERTVDTKAGRLVRRFGLLQVDGLELVGHAIAAVHDSAQDVESLSVVSAVYMYVWFTEGQVEGKIIFLKIVQKVHDVFCGCWEFLLALVSI